MAKTRAGRQLKHGLGKDAVERLARHLSGASSDFDAKAFVASATRGLASELRVRPKRIALGGDVTMSFRIRSTSRRAQRLVVDFAVHYVKANAETRPKVFKLKILDLAPGESVSCEKRISLRPISTRRYYPGEHHVEVLVNGASCGRASFRLSAPRA